VEETTTNNPAMTGLLVFQSNHNTKSQALSPREDQCPGKINISFEQEKPIKGRGRNESRGKGEQKKNRGRRKPNRKETEREVTRGAGTKRTKGSQRQRLHPRQAPVDSSSKTSAKKNPGKQSFPPCKFNSLFGGASMREQFKHAWRDKINRLLVSTSNRPGLAGSGSIHAAGLD
jgi:hypothetical protein